MGEKLDLESKVGNAIADLLKCTSLPNRMVMR